MAEYFFLANSPPPQEGLHSCICFYRLLAFGSGCLVLSSENQGILWQLPWSWGRFLSLARLLVAQLPLPSPPASRLAPSTPIALKWEGPGKRLSQSLGAGQGGQYTCKCQSDGHHLGLPVKTTASYRRPLTRRAEISRLTTGGCAGVELPRCWWECKRCDRFGRQSGSFLKM